MVILIISLKILMFIWHNNTDAYHNVLEPKGQCHQMAQYL